MDGSIPSGRFNPFRKRAQVRFFWSIAAGFCLVTSSVVSGQLVSDESANLTGKGPIGWDSYRRLDLLPNLLSGAETRDFSSTDPAQSNADYNHALRVTADGQYVIAETNGPGEIVSIWSTINGGDVTADGAITIQLDGKVVLSANYQALVSGSLGAPWVWPMVGNLYDTSGGAEIKVPMPFTKSMRVTVQGNPDYFHVNYRQFNDATGVETFNPKDKALDVIAKLRAFGMSDPKPVTGGAVTKSANIDIAPGSESQLVQIGGPAEITDCG